MKQTLLSVLLAASALFLGSCAILGPGYIGPVHAPVLDIPVPVNDVEAIEYGDQLIVTFSIPKITTEGLPLTTLRSVDLYAGSTNGIGDPNSWVRTATHYPVPGTAPGAFRSTIPAAPWIGKDLALYVRTTGPKGKQSLWSLPLTMGVIAPVPTPTGFTRDSRKDGVQLTWTGSGPKYRVLRSAAGAMPEMFADTDKPEYLDDSAQFGTAYQYLVLAFTDVRHQSLATEPLSITPKDTFPPDVPTNITADIGVNAIELQWDLNTEADFKGFNVFRSVDNGPFVKVASAIPAATYHDTDVQAGKSYRYQVSAADLLDNESNRSAPINVTFP